jgi:hypothetical protein
MRKTYAIILALFAFGFYASAQSVAFRKDGSVLESNAEITITEFHVDDFGDVEMKSGITLKNLTDAAVHIRIEQEVLERPKGVNIEDNNSGFYWCLSNCVKGWKNGKPMEDNIGPNEEWVAPAFHFDYLPGEYTGTAKVKYVLTNLDTQRDVRAVSITYNYSPDTKVDNISKNSDALSASYKNGALYVNYDFKDGCMYEITVNDITGKAVYQQKSTGGDGRLILPAQLSKGMYIISVENTVKNAISTKKFIVAN